MICKLFFFIKIKRYAADLKSADLYRSWGFKSPSGHQKIKELFANWLPDLRRPISSAGCLGGCCLPTLTANPPRHIEFWSVIDRLIPPVLSASAMRLCVGSCTVSFLPRHLVMCRLPECDFNSIGELAKLKPLDAAHCHCGKLGEGSGSCGSVAKVCTRRPFRADRALTSHSHAY
jgi:hypothetical protein